MRSRLVRLGAVVAALVGLLGGLTPPAHADTSGSIEFVGTAVLGGGLGLPVENLPNETPLNPPIPNALLGGTPTTTIDHTVAWLTQFISWATGAGVELDCSLPLNGEVTGAIPNCHPVYDHVRTVNTLTTAICVAEGGNVNKANKMAAYAGLCAVKLIDTPKPNPPENTVSGHCGLSGGQVSIEIAVINTIDGMVQTFTADIHFIGVATTLLLVGHYTKVGSPSNHGLVIGEVVAVSNPAGGSCLNKEATLFEIVGGAVLIPEPNL